MPPLRSLDHKSAVVALLLAALWGGNPVAVTSLMVAAGTGLTTRR